MALQWRYGMLAAAGVAAAGLGLAYERGVASPRPRIDAALASAAEQRGVIVAGIVDGDAPDSRGGSAAQLEAIVARIDARGASAWSRACPSTGALGEPRIAVGPGGDAALAITFQGSIDCGAGPVLAAGGASDFDGLIVKLDERGEVQWTRRLGDLGAQAVAAVALDPWGSVVAVGSFEGTLSLGEATITAHSERDVFLIKLDADGAPAWARRFGVSGRNFGVDVAAAPSGRIFLLSRGSSAIDFGSGEISATVMSGFVAAFDLQGRSLWSRGLGGAGEVIVTGLQALADDRVDVTGTFSGAVDLGGGALVAARDRDGFAVRLGAAGQTLFAARR